MKIYILITILFFTVFISYSQQIESKFTLNGYIQKEPKIITLTKCKFRKKKKVVVLEYMGYNWWKVNYNECIGYLKSSHLEINPSVESLKLIYNIKHKDSIREENERILKENERILKEKERILREAKYEKELKEQKINRERDSIIKARNALIESVKALGYDSSTITQIKRRSHLYDSDDIIKRKTILFVNKTIDAVVVGFKNDCYKVCIDTLCGYIDEMWIRDTDELKSFRTKLEIEKTIANHNKRLAAKKKQDEINAKQQKIYRQKYGEDVYFKLKKGMYWIGMTKEMAKISLGKPDHDNRSVGSWGVHNQWVYRSKGINLYFEDGILTSWQD